MEKQRAKQVNKENCSVKRSRCVASTPSSSSSAPKQYPTRKVAKTYATQTTSDDVCAVCSGAYVDDINEEGEITADWIQCADKSCGVWAHVDCLDKHAAGYMCAICFSIFK